jgi:hypothetical protein
MGDRPISERTSTESVEDSRVAGTSFSDAVMECWRTPELMAEYRRLSGSTLGLDSRSPIAKLIDEATGHDPHEEEYAQFFAFVRECVWLPLTLARFADFERSESSLPSTDLEG